MDIRKLAAEIVALTPRDQERVNSRHRPKGYGGEEKFDDIDLVVWKTEAPDQRGRLYAIAYQGRASKPLWNYAFMSETDMRKRIDSTVDNQRHRQKSVEENRKQRSEYKHEYKVGDILTCSWGYDQTNIDWYQVTDVRDKSVVLREIGAKAVGHEVGEDILMPAQDKFVGPPKLFRVAPGGSVKVRSFAWARKWDGQPERATDAYSGH